MSMVGPNNDVAVEFVDGETGETEEAEKDQNVKIPLIHLTEAEECEEIEDMDTSQWMAFIDPAPLLVKARFSITEITFPVSSTEAEDTERKGDEFLQMLIADGIPVSYVEDEPATDKKGGASDIGTILPPRRSLTDDSLSIPSTSESDIPITNVDDIVEVVGLSQPISTPLFFHYLPSHSDASESPGQTPPTPKRRGSAINPSMLQFPPQPASTPIKKKVRFNLPGRKFSIVGEYEVLPPHLSTYHQRRKRHRTGGGGGAGGRARKMGTAENDATRELNGALPPKKDPMKRPKRVNRKGITEEGEAIPDVEIKPSPEEGAGDENADGYSLKHEIGVVDFDNEDDADADDEIDDDDYDDYDGLNDDDVDDFEEDAVFDEDPEVPEIRQDDPDVKCGIFTWTPNFLQPLARSELYLLIFCIVALTQGMIYSYTISIVSTIQKRFHLSSTQAGVILIGNDMSQITITIFIAFYGTYANRPLWMGVASILSAFATFMAALPHFIYGPGEIAEHIVEDFENSTIPDHWKPKVFTNIELCNVKLTDNCSEENAERFESTFYFPQVILFVSQLLVGVANSVFWSVGVSYLDDNVSKKKTSLHIGFFTIARVLGPTFGFLFGAYCLSYWIDPTKSVDMSLGDQKWLGAWWIGFLFLALMVGIPGSFYFCFPKRLPHKNMNNYYVQPTQYFMNGNTNYLYQQQTTAGSFSASKMKKMQKCFSGFPPMIELPRTLTRLFTNKVWVANMLSNVFFILAMSSYFVYKPNYIQTQFRKGSSAANFYTGITTMVASVVAIATSAIVYRLFRPRTNYVTGFNIFLSIFGIISFFALMTIHCPSNELAGHLPGQEKWACSEHCSCSEVFSPICAEDGVTTFYSPCFAGCTNVNTNVKPYEYLNCTCFGRIRWEDNFEQESYFENESPGFAISEGWALDGYCPDNCRALTVYLAIHLINKIVLATGRIGGTLINLRCVEEKDKTLALGCLAVFVSLAGFIPASIIMGKAIDSTCIVWDIVCGEKGSCSFYDNERLRLLMHVIPAGFLVLTCIGDIVVHMNNRHLHVYGDSDEEESYGYSIKQIRKGRYPYNYRRRSRHHK